MNEQLRESLSALKDGEAESLEVRQVLASEAAEVNQQWRQLHHVSQLLKGKPSSFANWDISQQVSAVIADEPAYQQKLDQQKLDSHFKLPAWLRPVAGFAVAATVTAVVVLGAQHWQGVETVVTTPVVASQPAYPVNSQSLAVVSSHGQRSTATSVKLPDGSQLRALQAGDLAAQQKLQQCLLEHTEQSSFNNGYGMMNFARVVDFKVE